MIIENKYRSRACGEVSESDIGKVIRVAGWVENIRDHGGIRFVDLRDQYGIVQVVIPEDSMLDGVRKETVVTIEGEVTRRDPETVNPKISTGTVELRAASLSILGKVMENLPFEINASTDTKEEVRLKYRFLDLRNKKVKDNIILRSKVISFLRSEMERLGFTEIQTPILTASSPEGARDYLVPSRKHPGKFYALPQAPQQFKQLLMVSGFDRYFQIAPCLPLRRKYSLWQKKCCPIPSPSSRTRRWTRLRSCVSPMMTLCCSSVRISPTCAIPCASST